MDKKLFQNPPKSFREVPFWSLNDELDPVELTRQIELMEKAGWGGFFMHARVGLKTPYLGKRWMECIRAGVEAARQRSMGAWLYDEDKWPSGYAGGLSVAAHPEYRARYLVCKVDKIPALLDERIATFMASEVDGQLVSFRIDDHPVLLEENDRIVQFYPMVMPTGTANFNDYTYIDLMNPDAVQAFLASTHQVYADTFPEDLGKAIPGIFTDEPCYIFRYPGERPGFTFIPWTTGFAEYFQAQNGYDLLPNLPALFFSGFKDSPAYRYDFYRTALRRFIESFTQPVSVWCERHGLAYTGHYMAEDTLLEQIHWTGASMPHYPYMQVPGIDKLWRLVNGYCGMIATVKQLDSVVCQMGKSRALCENYGAAGPDFAHSGRKWIGDWTYVLGITLNNPHLSLYSLRGERKRDCPQNLFYQQPWWPENRLIADYFARLSYLLSQGQRLVDILTIHPIGSAWAVFQPGSTATVDELDEHFSELNLTLMRHHLDFHFADESLIAPGGTLQAEVVQEKNGASLRVGKMSYRLVIVPPGVTLAATTVDLLDAFAQAGGHILAISPAPTLIDGRSAKRPVLPTTTVKVTLAELPGIVASLLPFDIQIDDQSDVWIQHRRIDNLDCYFMANINPDDGTVATVHIRGEGRFEEWDPATGQVSPQPSVIKDGISETILEFAPAGSHLLVRYPGEKPSQPYPNTTQIVSEKKLAGDWQLSMLDLNSLTLDSPRLKVGSGPWSLPSYILDIHQVLAGKGIGTTFGLKFDVDVDAMIPGLVYLVLESPEQYKITLNGKEISNQDCGWWLDISFRKVKLPDNLTPGHHEIVLQGIYRMDSEPESIYLVGSFGVKAHRIGFENRFAGQVFDRYASQFSLVSQPQSISAAGDLTSLAIDLTRSGLPFFAGRARLQKYLSFREKPHQAYLEFINLRAAVASVYVNGSLVGKCAWQPHRVDLGSSLKQGENQIEIELASTTRNLLGPHHHVGGDPEGTVPGNFNDKTRWTDNVILVPFGFDAVTIKIMG